MKKFGYVVAALAVIAIAAPSIASAETVVVRHGDEHHGVRHDHWRHHDRVVIVKHDHHHHEL